jgi:aryl-alcohol dehydrogenase-like predicted oxidoreductase
VIESGDFGRTGHRSSRVIFGAAGIGRATQDEADEVLDTLLEFGVNHIDTAAAYGDSELRIAPWMTTHRGDFFLATKTGDRTGAEARASLERSLERLGVDQVDLIQLHNLVEDDEWEVAHGHGGAVEALVAARDEGLVRFIGVTGHGLRIPGMHLRSLARFDFDSVLFPYNFALLQNPDYLADAEALLAVCAERNVAVQTIKSMARRRWEDTGSSDPEPHRSWYEPIENGDPVGRAMRFVLSRDQLFLNTSSDTRLLRSTLAFADRSFGPAPSTAEMEADVLAMGVRPIFDGETLERI